MKFLLLSFTLFFASGNIRPTTKEHATLTKQDIVYICMGSSSYRYHARKKCRGLKNCGGSVKKINLQEAKNIGRTPCRICYR